MMVGNEVVDDFWENFCCLLTLLLVEDDVVGGVVVLACNNTSIQSRNSDKHSSYRHAVNATTKLYAKIH